jgi:hypothetical protein
MRNMATDRNFEITLESVLVKSMHRYEPPSRKSEVKLSLRLIKHHTMKT